MSSVYHSEPATSGRLVLETTHGPIEIHLWCRECPQTTRLFLQLMVDGFYDNMIFHRVVPGLCVQTGALRHNDNQKAALKNHRNDLESYLKAIKANEALQRRRFELNNRIKFNHRGQVAMAFRLEDDDDGDSLLVPQFFITLDTAEDLNAQHVIFGTVTGPTLFNVLRIANIDVDEATAMPVDLEYAPRITSAKVMENPVHINLVPTERPPWRLMHAIAGDDKAKKKKRKGKFDMNVLSFGNEIDDVESALPQTEKGSKLGKKSKLQSTKQPDGEDDSRALFHVDPSLLENRKENAETCAMPQPTTSSPEMDEGVSSSERMASHPTRFDHAGTKARVVQDNIDMRTSPKSEVRARRAMYTQTKSRGGRTRRRDNGEETLAKLASFTTKLRASAAGASSTAASLPSEGLASRMARRAKRENETNDKMAGVPTYHGQVLEGDDDIAVAGQSWMQTKFSCRRHMDYAAGTPHFDTTGGDGRQQEGYEVIDGKVQATREQSDRKSKRKHRRDKHSLKHWP